MIRVCLRVSGLSKVEPAEKGSEGRGGRDRTLSPKPKPQTSKWGLPKLGVPLGGGGGVLVIRESYYEGIYPKP